MSAAFVLSLAQVAATAPAKTLPAAPGIGSTLVALVLVLGLIIGLAWLLRRMPGFSQGLRGGNGLRVLATTQVGAKERVVIVTEGDTRWLLGVTAHGISLIDTLPPAAPVAATPVATPPTFLQALMRATGRTPSP